MDRTGPPCSAGESAGGTTPGAIAAGGMEAGAGAEAEAATGGADTETAGESGSEHALRAPTAAHNSIHEKGRKKGEGRGIEAKPRSSRTARTGRTKIGLYPKSPSPHTSRRPTDFPRFCPQAPLCLMKPRINKRPILCKITGLREVALSMIKRTPFTIFVFSANAAAKISRSSPSDLHSRDFTLNQNSPFCPLSAGL